MAAATDKAKVPVLRFPEFVGEWNTKSVSKVAKVTTGSKDTKDRIDGGRYPFFVRSDTIERIDTWALDCEAVITSGDGVGVGKNIHYINGKFDFHQRVYAVFDFSDALAGSFFYQFFREHFLKRVMRLSAKNSVDSVRMSMIADMAVPLPTLAEQKKIAAFLGAVDEKIAHLKEKKALLEAYKKGCMQQIFSQQIRFKRDDGGDFPDWESAPFGELVERVKTKFDPRKSDDRPIVVELENLETGTGQIIGQLALSEQKSLMTVFAAGDVLFGKLRPYLRKFAHPKFDGLCSSEIWALRGKSISNDFMFQMIQGTQFTQLANISTGSKMPRADWQTIADSEFEIPHPDEQHKIADFLSAIDAKIDLATQEIDAAQAFKKGLLQQMFV